MAVKTGYDEKPESDSHFEDSSSTDVKSTETPTLVLSPEEEKKLWRKVDKRTLPFLALMFLMSFLDRGNIGNAKLDGLTEDLHMTGNQYNIALTMFFIPYCICECPANLLLKRFKPSRFLPGITIVWGIIMTCMGTVKNYPQLVVLRVLLGIAEAGLFPGVVYYLSIWYPRHMLQFRIGLFFGSSSLAGAFSGLLAYGIGHMSGVGGKGGWAWIFILEGLATIIVGVLALIFMVDFPDTAKFLRDDERAYVIYKKKYDNSSVGEEEQFEWRHLKAAAFDWQVWMHIAMYYSVIVPLYGITLFLPSIINSFGYTTAISQLLTVPPYVCATILVYLVAHHSDRLRIRSPFIFCGLFLTTIGFAINISSAPYGVKYFGVFFNVIGTYAVFPGVIAWLGNNLAGHYKRGIGMAIHIGIGNFGGAIAANIYRGVDAPRYILGHAIELMFVGTGFITLPLTVFLYWKINKSRDEVMKKALENGEKNKYTVQELREMGDRAPDFRYML